MKVSAKTEYACLALLELARSYGAGEPVRIRTIADEHGVPSRFLVQILLQLKGAGLVASTRGAAGGYQLTRSPDEITLAEVMGVIDGPEKAPSSATAVSSPLSKALLRTWRKVAATQQETLRSITFADLLEQAKGDIEAMYYI